VIGLAVSGGIIMSQTVCSRLHQPWWRTASTWGLSAISCCNWRLNVSLLSCILWRCDGTS